MAKFWIARFRFEEARFLKKTDTSGWATDSHSNELSKELYANTRKSDENSQIGELKAENLELKAENLRLKDRIRELEAPPDFFNR